MMYHYCMYDVIYRHVYKYIYILLLSSKNGNKFKYSLKMFFFFVLCDFFKIIDVFCHKNIFPA